MMMTIRNLKHSNDAINFYLNKNFKENVFFSEKNNKYILGNEFFKQSHEIIFRCFADIIKLIGQKFNFVRGKKLDKVIQDIKSDRFNKATLGGCLIKKVNQTVIISKEL